MEGTFRPGQKTFSRRRLLGGAAVAAGTSVLAAAGNEGAKRTVAGIASGVSKELQKVFNPESQYIGQHLAVNFENGKVRYNGKNVLLNERPNPVEVTFKPFPALTKDKTSQDYNEMTIRVGAPSTASEEYPRLVTGPTAASSRYEIRARYAAPVLGTTTGFSPEVGITVNGQQVDKKYSVWYELTDRNGTPVDPRTGEPKVKPDGTLERFFVSGTQVAEVKPLQGYALATNQ